MYMYLPYVNIEMGDILSKQPNGSQVLNDRGP